MAQSLDLISSHSNPRSEPKGPIYSAKDEKVGKGNILGHQTQICAQTVHSGSKFGGAGSGAGWFGGETGGTVWEPVCESDERFGTHRRGGRSTPDSSAGESAALV